MPSSSSSSSQTLLLSLQLLQQSGISNPLQELLSVQDLCCMQESLSFVGLVVCCLLSAPPVVVAVVLQGIVRCIYPAVWVPAA